MAAKRLLDESRREPEEPEAKRMRTSPSFAAVIGEVVMMKSLQKLCTAIEPLLRRVVNEEVERGLRRGLRSVSRSPSFQIRTLEEAPTFILSFGKKLSLPVFTGSKIEDVDGNPLQILLVDTEGERSVPATLPFPIKVEMVVINGDFSSENSDDWSSEQFNSKIVRERTGKRPLLTGDVLITVRDGSTLIENLTFTDNSSWIRSRTFRLGARVAPGSCQGVRIREAMTEPFVVKDHRGESYRKHHPPSLNDNIWRLEKIGKDGVFHKKLASEGINTVQDFLKLWIVHTAKLRRILGVGMSDKTWEATITHAKTCVMGSKVYMFRKPDYTLVLNPICQVIGTMLNGQMYPTHDLTPVQRAQVKRLIKDAYMHWSSLEEVDGVLGDQNPLQPPGDLEMQYHNHHQNITRSNRHGRLLTDAFTKVPSLLTNSHVDYSGWPPNPTSHSEPIENGNIYNTSDSSSDGGDSILSRALFR